MDAKSVNCNMLSKCNCFFIYNVFVLQCINREIKWSMENMRMFVDKQNYKPIKAIIEHVRDGSTVRAFLLPDFYHITLMISGIRVSYKFEIIY